MEYPVVFSCIFLGNWTLSCKIQHTRGVEFFYLSEKWKVFWSYFIKGKSFCFIYYSTFITLKLRILFSESYARLLCLSILCKIRPFETYLLFSEKFIKLKSKVRRCIIAFRVSKTDILNLGYLGYLKISTWTDILL